MSVIERRQWIEELERKMEAVHDKRKTQALARQVKKLRELERSLLSDRGE